MKFNSDDVTEINQIVALLGHVADHRAYERLDDVFTDDAFYDCSIFGFGTASGLSAIQELMSRDGHAKAHHTTNVFISEISANTANVLSKGLGLLASGAVASITFEDRFQKTEKGWRLRSHVLKFNGSTPLIS